MPVIKKIFFIGLSFLMTITASAQYTMRLTDTRTNKTLELRSGNGVNFLLKLNDSTHVSLFSTIDKLEENKVLLRQIGYLPVEKIGAITRYRTGNLFICIFGLGMAGLGTRQLVNRENKLSIDIALLATSIVGGIQLHLAWNRWYLKKRIIGKRMKMEIVSDY